ncbi:MAG: hypothetical protein ACRDWH_06095 [Acidimicrobiia bacterium]
MGRRRPWTVCLAMVAVLAGCGSGQSAIQPNPDTPATTLTTAALAPDYVAATPGPVGAVEGFLAAEVRGEFEAGFEFLTEADQLEAGGSTGWVANHFLVLPVITGYRVRSDVRNGDRAEVVVDLVLASSLDQIVGLTAARATSTWVVVEEGLVWKLAFTESSLVPLLPDASNAPAAVTAWVEERQGCRNGRSWEEGLLGSPRLIDSICGSTEPVSVGAVERLDDAASSAPFLAAFGPQVGDWARIVPVEGPLSIRVVVAPVADQWIVIGVLES